MYIEEMIQSENSDSRFLEWSEYRSRLTDYLLEKTKEKNCVCLWGAGGCNDIDIGRLQEDHKLVLVDRDSDMMKRGVNKYRLEAKSCILTDLRFYDIDIEYYYIYEDMLDKGDTAEEVIEFLKDVLLEAQNVYYDRLPVFDISIAMGLVSQLNVRFAALLYHYKNNYSEEDIMTINEYLLHMEDVAVSRMLDAMLRSSKEVIIGIEANKHIAANNILCDKLNKLSDGGRITLIEEGKRFLWPFSDDKSYEMKIIHFIKTETYD